MADDDLGKAAPKEGEGGVAGTSPARRWSSTIGVGSAFAAGCLMVLVLVVLIALVVVPRLR